MGRILGDFKQAGVQVSPDKPVILLALSGQSYGQEIKPFFKKTKAGRCLKVNDHTYLGIKIGYRFFERATMKHRLHLSWNAFHRLPLSLRQEAGCWSETPTVAHMCSQRRSARYGLTAFGLDEASTSKYRAHEFWQLRIIMGNPGHLTHETNASLAARYSIKDPVQDLRRRAVHRIEQARCSLPHLQGNTVQQ